ncbi:protein GRAVITROPIC IN THE LIGHT 1-like [Silene latifolia]|uniref:protein GRAVITROPIC IN THE LIGHT 1-like n=1 Tax=Silene latifolia TaxID=37657 RepID=UPI003D774F77
MDCMKPPSSESTRSKFSKKFSKCIDPQTPSRFVPTQTKLKTLSEELNIKIKDIRSSDPKLTKQKSRKNLANSDERQQQQQHCYNNNNVVKEALVAKLFASVSSIKAAYAELQSAQFPYNGEAIKSADEDLVSELMVLSELKQKYVCKHLDLPPPHVAQLLAEIQEQQSNIKTYEITMKQMEWKMEQKDAQIASLSRKFEDVTRGNKSLEKRLNSSGALFPLRNNITLLELNQCHFSRVLHHFLRSLRHFIKHLVREMESKNWDMDLAAKAIQPNVVFAKSKHKIYAFESYVAQIMIDGFNHHNFFLPDEVKLGFNSNNNNNKQQFFFDSFIKMQSLTTIQVFTQSPKCPFARFCKGKYLKVVHPKMECSIFGNLEQRKVISSGAFPETEFFSLFAEMARRVWLLHCLAFSFDPPAVAFQVKRGCRFSEVYMESVVGEEEVFTGDESVMAAFTVVPGFKVGKTVIQSLVYTSPVKK